MSNVNCRKKSYVLNFVYDVISKPSREARLVELARSDINYDSLLLVYRGRDFPPVQNQKDFHRSMSDTFVSVHEWMILNERES